MFCIKMFLFSFKKFLLLWKIERLERLEQLIQYNHMKEVYTNQKQ